jgi:ribosomal protein L7Ae-like RNA K-turn-binding protein
MTLEDIARRTKTGIKRKQVVLGRVRFEKFVRRKEIGLVWFTKDLSRNVFYNYWKICNKHSIPTIYAGESEIISEITGVRNCKAYVFKKSFSGLSEFILQIPDEYLAWEDS